MRGLRKTLEDYLTIRRALGYKLEREGKLLPNFVAFLEEQGSPIITSELALQWAMQPEKASQYWWSQRLTMVRGFARHLHAMDAKSQIPSADLISSSIPRHVPHVYTDAEFCTLMEACGRLRGNFRQYTYSTLFGLLAVTGMRVGEAIHLDHLDIDSHNCLLVIRNSKFGKTREVALHQTTLAVLQAYSKKRDQIFPCPRSPAFFVSMVGNRLISQNVWQTFSRIRCWAGLADRPRPPWIHDIRHSFAIKTLIDWYRDGKDVEHRLPWLSTYLGHISPSSTYHYLTSVPELVTLAAERLEKAFGDLP